MNDSDQDRRDSDGNLALYTMEEAAEKLLMSRKSLQKLIKKAPYYRIAGKRKVFTNNDIRRLIESLPSPDNNKFDDLVKQMQHRRVRRKYR